MRFKANLVETRFLERKNRFLGITLLEGEHVEAYIPNPGRLKELLFPGAIVYLIESPAPTRKTDYDLVLVRKEGTLISIDSHVPNMVVREEIESGGIAEFRGFRIKKREPTYNNSRLDFLLTKDGESILLEVKSCTLVEAGRALFPDAPTERGVRHVNTLVHALEGGRSAILILVQRGDADVFQPNWGTDPSFSLALREAWKEGVEVYAYNCDVTLYGVFLNNAIPVKLDRKLT
ncbi:MAG: DNA/RNA nuclease SfsA [Candidatus Bathyarchaeia archaeon]